MPFIVRLLAVLFLFVCIFGAFFSLYMIHPYVCGFVLSVCLFIITVEVIVEYG